MRDDFQGRPARGLSRGCHLLCQCLIGPLERCLRRCSVLFCGENHREQAPGLNGHNINLKTALVEHALAKPVAHVGISRNGKLFVGKLHFQIIAEADGMGFAVDFDIDVVVADAIYLALDLTDGKFFAFVDF